jgi:putative flippase GtrA
MGVLVQAAALAFFIRVAGLHYMIATALAVETAVLHNFLWHRRWTWIDRSQSSCMMMLVRFNLTNGAVSMAGNLIFMLILVGGARLNAYAANLLTIALCSLLNFFLADRLVFTHPSRSSSMALNTSGSSASSRG